MSAAVDLSEQRRVEELARAQQERLQATARLATVGEMASLLSHELNQPLAAIASYASGSLNLLDATEGAGAEPAEPMNRAQAEDDRDMLRQSLTRIAEQADRAGRTIKSVHDFVRRREQTREAVSAAALIDAVLPLVRLQARKSATSIELQVPKPAPRVFADRTMVEQVLLNLTRNGIQAMETETTPPAARVLRLEVRRVDDAWTEFAVADAGPGIAPDVAQRLFTPFFTTRREGMGLGLSLCRTVIEQHGGKLDYDTGPGGTRFRFTLRSGR
jgi:two-component system sensor histidine kinase DctS